MNNSKFKIQNSKLQFFIFHFTFLIVFGIYLYTLCPTVSVGDSGEFITTASTLSLAHPPAYPLYSLLGKVFISLIPFGNIAYRINLMSAFFAVLTLFLIYRLLPTAYSSDAKVRLWTTASLLPVLLLAFSPIFWGVVCERLGKEIETLNLYEKALGYNPAHIDGQFNIAVVYWKKGDWEKVITALENVLRINPQHQAARNYLTLAREKLGRK